MRPRWSRGGSADTGIGGYNPRDGLGKRAAGRPWPAQPNRAPLVYFRSAAATMQAAAGATATPFCDDQQTQHRFPVRRRQHAARQRSRAGGPGRHLGGRLRRRRARPLLGRSSSSCAASWAMPTISARWSATGVEHLHDPELLRMANWLVDYPFADRLYPGRARAVRHVPQWGPTVILSDGDAVFQPRKVERSGLWHAFDGPRADLHPQGAGTGRRRAALPGASTTC